MVALGHKPSSYRSFFDRLLCEVKQPLSQLPGDRLRTAYSVEKLWFASGAKIHEEFDSILRAIASNG